MELLHNYALTRGTRVDARYAAYRALTCAARTHLKSFDRAFVPLYPLAVLSVVLYKSAFLRRFARLQAASLRTKC